MSKYVAVLNPSQRRGRFIPLLLTNGKLPISEGIIQFAGRTFVVRKYFRDIPPEHKPAITEDVHVLLVCEGIDDRVIAIRLLHSDISQTKYLYLNELTPPDVEVNFGYLCFRVRELDLHIRDYDPREPTIEGIGPRGVLREYGEDLDLTRFVLDIFANIARTVYGKKRLTNTYPYPEEAARFIGSGFREERKGENLVWVRDV